MVTQLPDGVRQLRTLTGHDGTIGRIGWSPDGRLLATPSTDGTVRIWNTLRTVGQCTGPRGRRSRTHLGCGETVASCRLHAVGMAAPLCGPCHPDRRPECDQAHGVRQRGPSGWARGSVILRLALILDALGDVPVSDSEVRSSLTYPLSECSAPGHR